MLSAPTPSHLAQAGHQFYEVAGAVAAVELFGEDLVPAVFRCAVAAGQGEDVGAARDDGHGAGLDRAGADGLIADPAEQFAKAGDLARAGGAAAVTRRHDPGKGLWRDVSPGQAGAAGGNDAIDSAIIDPGVEAAGDAGRVVDLERAFGKAVAGGADPFRQNVARCVGGKVAGVRHRQQRDGDGFEGAGRVYRHDYSPAGWSSQLTCRLVIRTARAGPRPGNSGHAPWASATRLSDRPPACRSYIQ